MGVEFAVTPRCCPNAHPSEMVGVFQQILGLVLYAPEEAPDRAIHVNQ